MSDNAGRAPNVVFCEWCHTPHKAMSIEYKQGIGCDCTVWQKDGSWWLQGHYGSNKFDCSRFRFVKALPSQAANPVCDACVTARIEAGDLEPVEGNYL